MAEIIVREVVPDGKKCGSCKRVLVSIPASALPSSAWREKYLRCGLFDQPLSGGNKLEICRTSEVKGK